MVANMNRVSYYNGCGEKAVEVKPADRVEMHLSRIVAMGEGEGPGGWPSEDQIDAAKKKFGVEAA